MINLLLTAPALNVFEQMALDEVLARTSPEGCLLRFYRWAGGPAVTFGYAQFVGEVRRGVEGTGFRGDICRRPTGGGVVYHTQDLTFSLIFSCADKPTAIYARLHHALRAWLEQNGVAACTFAQKSPAAAYAPSQQHRANACFVNPVENDLLFPTGQKILGGAIRRFGNRVLYQGSLQLPGARDNPSCKQAIIEGVRQFLGVSLRPQAVPPPVLIQARKLGVCQYQTGTWTEKF